MVLTKTITTRKLPSEETNMVTMGTEKFIDRIITSSLIQIKKHSTNRIKMFMLRNKNLFLHNTKKRRVPIKIEINYNIRKLNLNKRKINKNKRMLNKNTSKLKSLNSQFNNFKSSDKLLPKNSKKKLSKNLFMSTPKNWTYFKLK